MCVCTAAHVVQDVGFVFWAGARKCDLEHAASQAFSGTVIVDLFMLNVICLIPGLKSTTAPI